VTARAGTGSALRVRAAAAGDVSAVLDLLRAADLPTAGVEAGFAHFVVAEAEGRVVAAAGLERHGASGLLRSVVVDPAWRGRAAGKAVVVPLLGDAEREGLDAVYLLTTTAADWFPRFGFHRIPREQAPAEVRATEEFASLCPASAAVMRRRCTDPPARSRAV
jgi:amino-acid N-acetyltransferase